ncbi:uncharacterized protein LOC132334783 isoform X8 [Haemorhous mexicanus]|uniref:uncharacterized protein LOC132334783 isoform X8 n=1 Tax=Haemorhous mexicanus TaxID=30427 RepID=UPI0028BD9A9E|nr:uncharacterized protein LOC132334783 isoform X8 [Haemorhous mexicanus]XP_059716890.1 uncharacterized protein LOC132334783 isoform X8 [Haemorhous mexicanus]
MPGKGAGSVSPVGWTLCQGWACGQGWGLAERVQGGVPAGIKVLLTCCSFRQRCPEREEDEGGCAQRGPALLHPAVPPGTGQAQTDLLGGPEFPSLCLCPAPWSCVPPQPHKIQSRPSLCSPFQALLEGTQDDLRELDLDNVVVLETPLPPVAEKLPALLRQKRLAASLDA